MEKHIYIFKSETGECKIGVSNNVDKRRSTIEMQGGKNILEVFHTPKCFNAYEIESIMHRYFADKRLTGEWFNIDYSEAVSILEKEFNKNADFTGNKNDNFDYISFNLDNNNGLKIYFESDNNLTESENLILAFLRSLYTEKFADNFALSLEMIVYYITNKFLNVRIQKERTIINHAKSAILSLYEKGIIEIITQNGNNYIFNSKGLKLSEIAIDNLVEINHTDIHTIFSNCNKPFEITQFYINLRSLMKNNECKISQDEIVSKWHYGKTTVNSYIKQLKNVDLINVYKSNNKCNTYINIDK